MTERLQELAAGFASGALEAPEQDEFRALLRFASPEAKQEAADIINSAALVSLALPLQQPSPGLKEKILAQARKSAPAIPAAPGLPFNFIWGQDQSGWIPLPVPGAYVKPLSINREKGYSVVLGKLDPGTHYPEHEHASSEQIYILSGDLHIGDKVLHAGDFHHAEGGTRHGVNHSVGGCTILAVIPNDDAVAKLLLSQLAAAGA